jgi:myosin V
VHRLEERLMEKDTVLSTERQESETTKILLSEYQDKNQELLKKIEDAEKNIAHFQDTIQRSVT